MVVPLRASYGGSGFPWPLGFPFWPCCSVARVHFRRCGASPCVPLKIDLPGACCPVSILALAAESSDSPLGGSLSRDWVSPVSLCGRALSRGASPCALLPLSEGGGQRRGKEGGGPHTFFFPLLLLEGTSALHVGSLCPSGWSPRQVTYRTQETCPSYRVPRPLPSPTGHLP